MYDVGDATLTGPQILKGTTCCHLNNHAADLCNPKNKYMLAACMLVTSQMPMMFIQPLLSPVLPNRCPLLVLSERKKKKPFSDIVIFRFVMS